jgi:hypothetical protein
MFFSFNFKDACFGQRFPLTRVSASFPLTQRALVEQID